MKSRTFWRRLFDTKESRTQVLAQSLTETTEDIKVRATGPQSELSKEFKAIDLNGLTICYDARTIEITHDSDDLTYIRALGNLIIIYDRIEDLNGYLFAAESIQKIKMKD